MKKQEDNKKYAITQYKNEVNAIPMSNWTKEEMNFFFAVLTKLKDEKTKEVYFNRENLAELANYSITHNKRYKDTIQRLSEKIASLTYYEKTSNSFLMMPLFSYFKATWSDDLSELDMRISINPEFEYILNNWNEGNWTKFMLEEFLNLDSIYSKTLFRLLKQWKTVGKREFHIDEFRTLMDIPNSYTTGMITKRIINTSVKELQPYFANLKVEVVKARRRGTPVIGYTFTFSPEVSKDYTPNKYENNNKNKKRKKSDRSNEYQSIIERKRKERFERIKNQNYSDEIF